VLKRGDPVLFRFILTGRVFWALPATVVEDSAERSAIWVAPQSPIKRPEQIRVPIRQAAASDWTHSDKTWFGGGVLMLSEHSSSHSIWPRWDEEGRFGGWYVNLEEPWRRSGFGFDTHDHALDIVVLPDRTWHWKDEDDLAECVEVGLFTPQKAREIRAEGERVIERLEAWTAPFDEGWENWRPDPDWPLPSLPDGWATLEN
jgi:hypothetical protein